MRTQWAICLVILFLAPEGCSSRSTVARSPTTSVDSKSPGLASVYDGRSHSSTSPRDQVELASKTDDDKAPPAVSSAVASGSDSTQSPQIMQVALRIQDNLPDATDPELLPKATTEPPETDSKPVGPESDISVLVPEISEVPAVSSSPSQETLTIDLATVIRLVNDNSPAVGFSRAKVQEAQARAQAADLLWLPNLSAGTTYNRFDGQTQNQRGEVFGVSRSNLFANGGVALTLDVSEAIYRPLIAQRIASAEEQRADATSLAAELDAIIAYLELSQIHGLIEINAQTLEKGEAMLTAAKNAQRAKLDRSPGDVNRVQTEVLFRRQERLDLKGKAGVASARLAKLLLLRPTVWLVPQTAELVPITLVNPETPLDELVSMAIQNRPDLAASREILSAAWERVRKAQREPLLPKVQVVNQGGVFGGGKNADIQDFAGRNAATALLYWELKNLGFGNRLEISERQAGVDQAHFVVAETQARMSSEVVEAAQMSAAKLAGLSLSEQTVNEAIELYRINQEGTFNVIDAKNLFDALRPLQALQMLNQAKQNRLSAVLDYTRAQYRLYLALGCPAETALNAESSDS